MIIFVGDKPSPRMKPGAKPFEGAACEKRLNEWINFLTVIEDNSRLTGYADETWRYKLMNSDNPFALRKLEFEVIQGNYKVIALGNNASKALKGIPHFKLPHPSGKNLQINDKDFVSKKLEECKKWLNV